MDPHKLLSGILLTLCGFFGGWTLAESVRLHADLATGSEIHQRPLEPSEDLRGLQRHISLLHESSIANGHAICALRRKLHEVSAPTAGKAVSPEEVEALFTVAAPIE